MLTGADLMNELVDELNELKLSTMAATLDDLYHRPGFLEMDRLTMIVELIGPQFQEKVSTTLKNRLTTAHLKGSPEELVNCVDSDKREYLPSGITEMLSANEKEVTLSDNHEKGGGFYESPSLYMGHVVERCADRSTGRLLQISYVVHVVLIPAFFL